MRTLVAGLATLVLFCAPSMSYGTTWATAAVTDPVSDSQIEVAQPASSGSYIYQWPEKSDQVFWPYADDNWLWFNPMSGYIAFGDDFEEVESAQREKLKEWLKANYSRQNAPLTRLEHLYWAEQVYSVRGMSDDFWCHFYRGMAVETRDDPERSIAYVKMALPLLIGRLSASDDPGQRLETLYLLSEYNRRLGKDTEAASYLDQLTAFQAEGDLAGFKTYLLEIAKEQRGLPPITLLQRQGD